MDIEDLMNSVNRIIHLHDSSLFIEYVYQDDSGIVMQVVLTDLDKFMGLNEIKKIINKYLNKYQLKLKSLYIKKLIL